MALIKIITLDLVDTKNENWLEDTRGKMQELIDLHLNKTN